MVRRVGQVRFMVVCAPTQQFLSSCSLPHSLTHSRKTIQVVTLWMALDRSKEREVFECLYGRGRGIVEN